MHELTWWDLYVIEEIAHGNKDVEGSREKAKSLARSLHWKSASTCSLTDGVLPVTEFDMECVKLNSMVWDLGRLWRGGVRWRKDGRIVRSSWSKRYHGGMSRKEAQGLIYDLVRHLPVVILETRLDRPDLALEALGLGDAYAALVR